MTEPSDSSSTAPTLDVVCVGNAIVDVIATAEPAELERLGLAKGAMTLIDADRAQQLYEGMGPGVEVSGGSAANTAAGVASLGGSASFIGRVADDQLGDVFTHDIRAAGVGFDCVPANDGLPTARCLIFVTPDADRTMNTFLGAANELHADDIDPAVIAAGRVLYLEGYLWDPPEAKKAYRRAIQAARHAGRQVAFSLSDVFCVERHREEFCELLTEGVDLVFGNGDEACSMLETDDLDHAIQGLAKMCRAVAVTLGADGCAVVVDGDRVDVPAAPVARLVDTTGAGDLYAAGFLWGWGRGRDPETCGRLGALAAAEVISHTGGRPEKSLADLVAEAGLAG